MAQDNELQLALKIEADNSIENAAQKLDKVTDAYDNVSDAAKKASKETDTLSATLAKIDRERALENLAKDAADAAKAGTEVETVIQELNKQLKAVGANESEIEKVVRQFDRLKNASDDVNPDLDLANKSGDNASIAGQTRGALDVLTGGNAGGLGQALEGAEAVFDLGEAAGKLGGPIGKAATALGPAGLAGVAAGAGIALVALNIGFSIYAKEAQKAREVQSAYTDSLKETIRALEEGATSGETSDRRAELEKEIEIAQRQADALRQVREARNEENNIIEDIFTKSRVLAGGTRTQLNEDITAADNAVRSAEASLEAFNFTLDENELAANDAAAAEKELAAARTQGVLTDAQQAGELAATRERLSGATREQIDTELQSIEVKRIAIEAELASLQASGDTSEEVKNRIESLNETLSFLGEQSEQLNSIRASAKTDKQVEAEKELTRAREETAKASVRAATAERSSQSAGFARRRADSARNRSAGTLSFGFLTGQSGAGEQNPDTNEIEKQLRDAQNSIIKVNNDFEEQRVQQVIDNNRRLMDIARDFGDQRADAFEEGNFLALAKLNTEESRAERDQSLANRRANDDRLREQQNSLRDLRNQEQQFHQQRLQLNQQGFQSALNQQQQFINAFIGNFSNMFGALSGRSGIRRPATP